MNFVPLPPGEKVEYDERNRSQNERLSKNVERESIEIRKDKGKVRNSGKNLDWSCIGKLHLARPDKRVTHERLASKVLSRTLGKSFLKDGRWKA